MSEPAAKRRTINDRNARNVIQMAGSQQHIPYSEEAEQAVLGAVLTNPDALATLDFITAEDFYLLRHAYIWRAIERLEKDPQIGPNGINFVSVSDELRKVQFLDQVGMSYLLELVNNCPSAYHAEVYGRLVQRAAGRRRLVALGDELKQLAVDESTPWEQVIDEANKRLFEATDQRLYDADDSLGAIASDYFAQMTDDMDQPGRVISLPTGFKAFDKQYGGLHRKELVVVVAPSGTGKTTWCLNVAANVARLGKGVAIFALGDQNKDEIFNKFVQMETGIHEQALKRRDITPEQFALVTEAVGRLAKWPVVVVDDMLGMTPLQFKRRVRRIMHRREISLVIVDGLWLMLSDDDDSEMTRFNTIAKGMAEAMKELNIRLLMTHQYNRNSSKRPKNNKRPQPDDLMGGGVHDSYLILALHREKQNAIDTELIPLKHRGGLFQPMKLWFNSRSGRYMDKGAYDADGS